MWWQRLPAAALALETGLTDTVRSFEHTASRRMLSIGVILTYP
jgi:hypothetical protein